MAREKVGPLRCGGPAPLSAAKGRGRLERRVGMIRGVPAKAGPELRLGRGRRSAPSLPPRRGPPYYGLLQPQARGDFGGKNFVGGRAGTVGIVGDDGFTETGGFG